MAKANKAQLMGTNVLFVKEGSIFWFGVDGDVQGQQSGGSKGFKTDGTPKQANEMVGSTGSYTGVPETDQGERVMLHLIRPMEHKAAVTATRKARAVVELHEDDAKLDIATLRSLAEAEGCSITEVIKRLGI